MSTVHRYGFNDPRNFVLGLLDCVFRRANELNPALCLPVLSDVADREQELQRQLAELKKTQVADLGALRR